MYILIFNLVLNIANTFTLSPTWNSVNFLFLSFRRLLSTFRISLAAKIFLFTSSLVEMVTLALLATYEATSSSVGIHWDEYCKYKIKPLWGNESTYCLNVDYIWDYNWNTIISLVGVLTQKHSCTGICTSTILFPLTEISSNYSMPLSRLMNTVLCKHKHTFLWTIFTNNMATPFFSLSFIMLILMAYI